MAGSWNKVNAVCLFFIADNGQTRVRCEGYCAGASVEWIFRRPKDFTTQMDTFCYQKFENCEHYRALMLLKYNEE